MIEEGQEVTILGFKLKVKEVQDVVVCAPSRSFLQHINSPREVFYNKVFVDKKCFNGNSVEDAYVMCFKTHILLEPRP